MSNKNNINGYYYNSSNDGKNKERNIEISEQENGCSENKCNENRCDENTCKENVCKESRCNENKNEPKKHVKKCDDSCCCKNSMREALKLLNKRCLHTYLDFNKFAFIAEDSLVGVPSLKIPATPGDDSLTSIEGSLFGFSPSDCDLLKVSGSVLSPPINDSVLDPLVVNYASLCKLIAVAFELSSTITDVCNKDTCDYNTFLNIISQDLDIPKDCDGNCSCKCECDDCCCNTGIWNQAGGCINTVTSLVAGPLALYETLVLGKICNVMVLATPPSKGAPFRVYFVCLDSVSFLS
ncbi:CotA family spore coat protein [Romboutsia sp.]|uniref:CotA family spore coat protein n=1 Tax=Romboutsia sp. TaxID=1965302 RepID=UPI003F39F953